MPKQAELLPAWMHPDNGQTPKPADGERFRPSDEHWLDSADDNASYIANGHGYFEGFNGKVVREHPGHTLSLVVSESYKNEYELYASLNTNCWATNIEELSANWLKLELEKRGVKFSTCRIGLKTWKTAREEITAVEGLTQEIHDEVHGLIQIELDKKQEQQIQWSKEQRLKYRGFGDLPKKEEQKIEMIEARDLVKEWKGAFELARERGIPDERVQALFRQTAFSGETPELSNDTMDLLYRYIRNEIEVKETQERSRQLAQTKVEPPLPPVVEPAPCQASGDAGLDAISRDTATVAELTVPVDTNISIEATGSITINANAADAIDINTLQSISAESEIIEVDGYKINKETGEIIDVDPTVAQELIGPIPQEIRKGETFTVHDEASARWLIKRIRSKQREIEEAERELKELKNQVDVIRNRRQNEIKGMRFVYGRDLADWCKSQLPLVKSGQKKGQFRSKSLVFTEGTLKFSETGGAICIDKHKFNYWWQNLSDAERQLYPHKVTCMMLNNHIEQCLNDDIEIPGYVKKDIDPIGDWDVTTSVPRKSKKGAKVKEVAEEIEEETEPEDEDGNSESEAA